MPYHVFVYGNDAADQIANAPLYGGSEIEKCYTVSEIGGQMRHVEMAYAMPTIHSWAVHLQHQKENTLDESTSAVLH